MKNFVTIRLGGPAKFFVAVKSVAEMLAAVESARALKLSWMVVGEGSNLVVSDKGYKGVVIQNRIEMFKNTGRLVRVGTGSNLLRTIFKLDRLGLSGMEKMAGIPGTVGGAIYGCAGAYGQEIKDCLTRVWFYDGKRVREYNKDQCQFGYRSSIFKKRKNWIVLEAEFGMTKGGIESQGNSGKLIRISRDIIKLRRKKYPAGLRSPGSFFKNIRLVDIKSTKMRAKLLRRLPEEKIVYGKVPVGFLLESVGARGMRQGKIRVAGNHGNLIYNSGRGRSSDVKKLTRRLQGLVKKKFGVTIEEEVQYL